MKAQEGDLEILDVIGVGIGPFNLGLAALLEPIDGVRAQFFDVKETFLWHEGLLLDDCHLQVPFLADLVTMSDPTSRFSFLSYLHSQGRLYQFYFYERFQIPRIEYNRYCQWVAGQLKHLHFSSEVIDIEEEDGLFCVSLKDAVTGALSSRLARNIVIGVGAAPAVPQAWAPFLNDRDFVHSARYVFAKEALQKKRNITLIGGGQSAAECFLDLLKDHKRHGYQLNWLTRGSGFFPMEYSKLGLEHFSPDYIEHFHRLPHPRRTELLASQANWYKGISFGTIAEIYDCLYASTVDGPCNVVLQARSELEHVAPTDFGWALSCRHVELEEPFHLQTEAVVLGAGYQYNFPSCLEGLRHLLDFHSDGRVTVQRDYSLKTRLQGPGRIFIQNGEMHTHGVAAPDLGLGSHRNATIINALLGEQRYATSSKTVFQTFGIADCWQPVASS
jgi:lysine N6-hydroxylase